jgi:hypothetical protein
MLCHSIAESVLRCKAERSSDDITLLGCHTIYTDEENSRDLPFSLRHVLYTIGFLGLHLTSCERKNIAIMCGPRDVKLGLHMHQVFGCSEGERLSGAAAGFTVFDLRCR